MLSTKRTYEFSQHVLLDWQLLICSRTIMHSFFCRSQQKTQEEKEISVEFKIISQLRKKSKGKNKINLSQAKKLLEMQNKRDRIAKVCLLGPYSVKEGWFYLSLFKSQSHLLGLLCFSSLLDALNRDWNAGKKTFYYLPNQAV